MKYLQWAARECVSWLRVLTCISLLFSVVTLVDDHLFLFEILTHFRAQYFLIGCLSLLSFSLLKSWRWLGMGGLLFLLNISHVAPWYVAVPEHSQAVRLGRFMVANIRTENTNVQAVLARFGELKPDILAVLELDTRWADGFKGLATELPFSRALPHSDNFGIGLFSRYPLDNLKEIEFDKTGATSLSAQVTLNGVSLNILATHALPPASPLYFQSRNRHLDKIAEFARGKSNLVILGDLNASMWSPYYRAFVEKARLLNARQGWGILPTWPRFIPPMFIPIDQILFSAPIESHLTFADTITGSDHKALVADLYSKNSGTM